MSVENIDLENMSLEDFMTLNSHSGEQMTPNWYGHSATISKQSRHLEQMRDTIALNNQTFSNRTQNKTLKNPILLDTSDPLVPRALIQKEGQGFSWNKNELISKKPGCAWGDSSKAQTCSSSDQEATTIPCGGRVYDHGNINIHAEADTEGKKEVGASVEGKSEDEKESLKVEGSVSQSEDGKAKGEVRVDYTLSF